MELPSELLNNQEAVQNLENKLIDEIQARISVSQKFRFINQGTLPEIQGKVKRVVIDNIS